jgi:thioredoxin 1
MRNLTNDALEDALRDQAPLLVCFTASWCSASLRMASKLHRLEERACARVSVGIVEVDEEPSIPARFGVRGLPTTMLFIEGAVASTRIGTLTDRQFEEWVEDLVQGDGP